jgi:hypothetical protein
MWTHTPMVAIAHNAPAQSSRRARRAPWSTPARTRNQSILAPNSAPAVCIVRSIPFARTA